ncbi:MAG: cytochrome c oxidase subunit II [Rickettsiales bacterium]
MYLLYPLTIIFASLFGVSAFAGDTVGMAEPWQLGFQEPATPVMEKLYAAHDKLLWLISAICIFVLVAMLYICLRFNRKANPTPSKTAHNTKLEIIWTVVPILILVAIAIPSLRLHYYMEDESDAEMTIKVVGYQWYWNYEYPDHGGFAFDSYMKKEAELKDGEPRLLAVDNHIVVPVDTKVKVQLTAADVIHAWAVPAFGVKRDAVPGRLNETWFKATKTGRFYGQCSELCGVGHGFMPVVVDVVSKAEFDNWVIEQRKIAGIPLEVELEEKEGEAPEAAAKAGAEKPAEPEVKTDDNTKEKDAE